MKPIRVMLVDDQPIVLQGVRSFLEGDPRVEVMAAVHGADEALQEVERTDCDVVILDLHLSGKDGFWCLAQLKEKQPGLPVLILSVDRDSRSVVACMKAGASGYLPKSGRPEELIEAVCLLSTGGTYLHPGVAGCLVRELKAPGASDSEQPSPRLTAREREVLDLLSLGMDAPEVADRLGLSVNTAKTYLHSLYRKFGVSDRTRLVLAAQRLGVTGSPRDSP